MSNIQQLATLTRDAQQAARQMYMVNESLSKYLTKQGKVVKQLGDLRKIATKTGKEVDRWKGVIKTTEKLAKKSDGIVTKLTKGLFKQVNPKLGATVNSVGMLAQAGITVLAVKSAEYIQEIDLRQNTVKEAELNRTTDKLQKLTLAERRVDAQITEIKRRIDNTNADTANAANAASKARDKANDALYEVRKGREILELKHKQQNDILYEHKVKLSEHTNKLKQHNDLLYAEKQERLKLGIQFAEQKTTTESKIQQLKSQFQQLTSTVTKGASDGIQSTITQLKQGIQEAKQESKAAKDFATTVQKTLELSKALTDSIKRGLEATTVKAENALQEALKAGQTIKLLDGKIEIAANNAAKQWVGKVVEPKIYSLENGDKVLASGLSNLAGELDKVKQLAAKPVNVPNYQPEINNLSAQDTKLKNEIENLKKLIKEQDKDISNIETKIKDGEKVDKEANGKLDKILPLLGTIPGLITAQGQLTRTQIPTIPQIQTATETAICNSAAGGCLLNSQNALGNQINANVNANHNDLLNKLNLAGQGVDLALLAQIDRKIGGQLPGGLSGFLQRLSQNAIVDRVLSLLTFATALHNAQMLSVNLSQTLFSVIDNVLAIFGIKDSEGNQYSVSDIVGRSFENLMKGLLGETEWGVIKLNWARVNRIYQAGANAINEVRNIGSSIINAVEQTARLTGKGFNALQDEGILSESNWNYTPEELKLKGGLYAKLGKLSDGISTVTQGLEAIESITSEIRSAVDSANQIKEEAQEIDKSVKELIGQSTAKREEEVAALPPKSYSWEDLI